MKKFYSRLSKPKKVIFLILTGPLFVLLGSAIGFIAGMYAVNFVNNEYEFLGLAGWEGITASGFFIGFFTFLLLYLLAVFPIFKAQLTITYFVHGSTTDNENNIATGQLPGELSELGKKQMLELKNMVADKKFDAVFCSDLKRAIDSAQITFGDKYKIITDQRLRECDYGDYNGAPEDFKNNMNDFVDKPFPNGESYKDVEKRLVDFLQDVSKKYNNKHIAIVAHQAPQLALEVLLNNKSWPEAIATDWRKTKSWQAGWSYSHKS